MATVRELFATVGMDVDTSGFIKASLAVEAIKLGLATLKNSLVNAAKGMGDLILSSAKTADDIGDLAERTGVSAEALQKLGYGAKLSGVGMDQLAIALNFMAKKGVKDVEGGLEKLADRIAALPDDGSRARLAMQELGRSGAALVPMLSGGSAEVRRLGEEAEALGIIMDAETLKTGGQFSDTWDALTMAVQAAGRALAFEFIPDLLQVLKAVLGWVKENRALIKQKVRAFALGVAEAVDKLWTALKTVWQLLRPLREGLGWLADKLGAANLVLAALAALILGPAVAAIGSLIASLFALTAAEIMAAAIPVLIGLALLALIGVIALVAEDLYQFFNGGDSITGDLWLILSEDLPDAFWSLVEAAGAALSELWEGIRQFGLDIFHALTDPIVQTVQLWIALFTWLFSWVSEKVSNLGGAIGQGLLSGVRAVAGLIPGGAGAVDSLFGGGASPSASVANSPGSMPPTLNAPQFNAGGIVINATPGMDEEAVADLTARKLEDFWSTKNREALAAVGEAP